MVTQGSRIKKNQPQTTCIKYLLVSVAIFFAGLLLVQVFYPSANLPLGTKISGKNLGGWNKKSAINELNRLYSNSEIDVFLADSEDAYKTVSPDEIGLEIDNTRRINLIEYPWYARLVPTSLFWWGSVVSNKAPDMNFDDIELQKYIEDVFGTPCYVEPKNASLAIDGTSINILKSRVGGTCYQNTIKENFKNISFDSSDSGSARIDLIVEYPVVSTEDARALAIEISPNIINDLKLESDEMVSGVTLSRGELTSWISFSVIDGELTPVIDETKSSEFYKTKIAPLVEQSAGVTTIIATEDLNAVRIDGVEGKVINIEETNLRIVEYLRGLRKTVMLAIESTDPSISYVYERPQLNQEQIEDTENVEENENQTENTEDNENDDN